MMIPKFKSELLHPYVECEKKIFFGFLHWLKFILTNV